MAETMTAGARLRAAVEAERPLQLVDEAPDVPQERAARDEAAQPLPMAAPRSTKKPPARMTSPTSAAPPRKTAAD